MKIYEQFGNALRAVSSGYSANEFYRTLQAEGYGARRSEVLKLYAQARTIVSQGAQEPYRNPHAIPTAGERGTWPTRGATGLRQNVTLTYRDKTTGDYKSVHWSTISRGGITRAEAVQRAIDAYSGTADAYEQEFVGAYHASAQDMIADIRS